MEALTNTNFADLAEKVINDILGQEKKEKSKPITTSKIRKLLTMTNALYDQARLAKGETLDDGLLHDIQYLKMRFAYEAGRDLKAVKPFVDKAEIMEHIDRIGNSRAALLLFCNYMESLVAYHRFYGGKDR